MDTPCGCPFPSPTLTSSVKRTSEGRSCRSVRTNGHEERHALPLLTSNVRLFDFGDGSVRQREHTGKLECFDHHSSDSRTAALRGCRLYARRIDHGSVDNVNVERFVQHAHDAEYGLTCERPIANLA